mgnify:CR=1 FL=1
MEQFTKPTLSYADQISLLKERGLLIADDQKAFSYLNEIAYYRLSAYFIPYEKERHVFQTDTSFEQIVALYEFDHKIRQILDNALEKIELFLRSQISNTLALNHGPFAHEEMKLFSLPTEHQKWINKVHDEASHSKEIFIKHYKTKYEGFPTIPIWMATEIISLGTLSYLYKNLQKDQQQKISNEIGIPYLVLEKWLHFFTYIRNICAHHARLWNRTMAICPVIPRDFPKDWSEIRNDKLAFILIVINFLLSKMPNGDIHSKEWKKEVHNLFLSPPTVPHFYESIGLESKEHFLKLFS